MSRKQISAELEKRVREAANNRCGYCLMPQKLFPLKLEIEHIRPLSKGGTDDEKNLWLSCRACNSFKGTQTKGYDRVTRRKLSLFNPRSQKWSRHFKWSKDGTHIVGLTACGRVTIEALNLNNSIVVRTRSAWVSVGWHPPQD